MKHRTTFVLIHALDTDGECLILPGIVWSRHRGGRGVADALHVGWLFWGIGVQWARLRLGS